MVAHVQSGWHWSAVVWDKDADAHPIGSFRIEVGEARRRAAAKELAESLAVARWPNRRLDIDLEWMS